MNFEVSLRLRVLASSSSFFLLLFNFAQLARLRCSKLLAWSPSLGRFADTTTLAARALSLERELGLCVCVCDVCVCV